MKIKSVVADELPDSCLWCKFMEVRGEGKLAYDFCILLDEKIDLINFVTARPLICPLILEDKADKFKIKLLEANLAEAMAAINDTCDYCGWSLDVCESDECRFLEFRKQRKDRQ